MKKYLKFLFLFICNLTFYQLAAVDLTTCKYTFEVGEVRTFSPGRIIATSTSSDRTIADCVAHLGENKVTFTAMKPGIVSYVVSYQDSKGVAHGINYVIEVIVLTNITIPQTLSVKVGETYKFNPIIQDSRMEKYLLEWKSTDCSIATIDNDYTKKVPIPGSFPTVYETTYIRGGSIVTHKPGRTLITCSYKNISASCQLTVEPIYVSNILFQDSGIEMTEFQNIQLNPTILPENATNKDIDWKSTNPSVAIVDNKGVVTALNKGKTVITASSKDGSQITSNYLITVNPLEKENVEIELMIDDFAQFSTNIEHGTPFEFSILPPTNEWRINSFTVNGKDAANELVNGKYSIDAAEESMIMLVEFAYEGQLTFFDMTTGISSIIGDSNISISKKEARLYLSNVKVGAEVKIYTMGGHLVGQHISVNNALEIEINPGYYVLSIDGDCVKIKI